jgi:hypothetical protein
LIISQSGEYGTLVVDNLAALDADHQYQILPPDNRCVTKTALPL